MENNDNDEPAAHLCFSLEDIGSRFMANIELNQQLLKQTSTNSHLWANSWKSPNSVVEATKALMSRTALIGTSLPKAQLVRHKDTVLIDSCATLHITSKNQDLVDFVPADRNIRLKGIAKGLQVVGFGNMRMNYDDDQNVPRILTLRRVGLVTAPAGSPPLRLLSPQTLCRDNLKPSQLLSFTTWAENSLLKFRDHEVSVPYSQINNLPSFKLTYSMMKIS